MVSKGHKKAGRMGLAFEKDVANMLKDVGFVEIKKQDVEENKNQRWYCRQYKGFVGVYEKLLCTDLLIFEPQLFPGKIAVELKYQGVKGSVDEKFPFVVANLRKIFKEHGVKGLLMLNGGAYSENALRWCQEQQDENLVVVEGRSAIYNWIEENLVET